MPVRRKKRINDGSSGGTTPLPLSSGRQGSGSVGGNHRGDGEVSMEESVSIKEAEAIMARVMNGGGLNVGGTRVSAPSQQSRRDSGQQGQGGKFHPRQTAPSFDSSVARDAKKLRTATMASTEVSVSGQSDLVEGSSTISGVTAAHPYSIPGGANAGGYGNGTGNGTQLVPNQVAFEMSNDQTAEVRQNGYPQKNESGGGHNDEDEQEGANAESSSDNDSMEADPDWETITQNEPARAEVPKFLDARARRGEANTRFALALDDLDDSVGHNVREVVQVVSELLTRRSEKLCEYEQELKADYAYSEKMRASMQTKLEESARAAQGLFAKLLMRVAQNFDSGAGVLDGESPGSNGRGSGEGGNTVEREDLGDEDPDWDAITQHEPARTEVPIFLSTRERREAADARFTYAIEEYQAAINNSFEELTQTVADMYNARSTKLDEYEQSLKQHYVSNDEIRATMQTKLEESAAAAHSMFENLLARVMQPGMAMAGISNRAPPQDAP